MEEVDEIIERERKNKKKTNKKKKINIIMIIVDILIILLVGYFIIGYLNFSKIKDGKDPVFVVDTKTYDYDSDTIVTVYDNKIYKVVKQENKDKNIIYSLKLWFMDDVKANE
jgi:flagellar basal body-associated protein FliL